MPDDLYRDGSLWKHRTKGDMVTVKGSTEDTVWFVYVDNDIKGKPFTTSKPLFEMFYERMDLSEEGLYYLSKV